MPGIPTGKPKLPAHTFGTMKNAAGLIARVACNIRTSTVDPRQLRGVTTTLDNEPKSLLRRTVLNTNAASYQEVATKQTSVATWGPSGSRPVIQPLYPSKFVFGGDANCIVMSPVEGVDATMEQLETTITPKSGIRGRSFGVTQKKDPISSNGSDIRATKLVSQIFESPSPVQEDYTVSNNKKPQTQHVPTSNLRAHTAPCIRNPSISLVKSLTGLISLRQAKVHILGVGTSWEGQGDRFEALPGPSHDIEWLKNAFAHQQNFWFNSLLDHNVTLATIRQSLDRMFSVAEESDLLALYFSGHGGYDDQFELYDSTSLDEVILNEWIVEFRSSNSAHNPVYIVFDFCRPGRVRPQAELASDVKVIWACSPTQPALELKLKDPNNALPRSCFLLSLILAIGDVSEDPTLPALAIDVDVGYHGVFVDATPA
ncbi:ICE-like protease (caspase) p20 domain protein [Rhizoctonia solani]|uniref:ICE-like protease (Caspase) p20 domain protein n=1 Tax=Rhizoctonia solani TaxID=456999 RepID=A0A8H8NSW1_9AGAM|nr:ICE-like protease (caspase) p20 domain protein [Rhizoctonia solani]QRW18168.1 ICE-like protease (caspase) p20 domain protein [Rhizoctonia solani]